MLARAALLVILALAGSLSASTVAAGQRQAPSRGLSSPPIESVGDDRIARLERWLKAVARHVPGKDDEALEEIAGWPSAHLQTLWIDATVLVEVMRGSKASQFNIRAEGRNPSVQIHYSKSQVERLRTLACAAGGGRVEGGCLAAPAGKDLDAALQELEALARAARLGGDDNYLLRHGALLHGDVAVLAPSAMDAPRDARSASAVPRRFRMEVSDGHEVDLRQSAVHWELARMLLDFVKPRGSDRADPKRDEMVRQWYRATAAWMQLREDHDKIHIDRARELFPTDPDILFLSGCQRETFAGAPIQTAVRSAVLPFGVTMDVRPEGFELRDAATFFRRTVEAQPDHAEARLHYGRVMGLMGRHAEAAVELRRAVTELTDTQLRYYGALFLGAEEAALDQHDAARAAYEEAARLAPHAQSPLLGLSELARRHGNGPEALRAIGRLFAVPDGDRSEDDDPWWWYYVSQGRDADDLLEAMRRPYVLERFQ